MKSRLIDGRPARPGASAQRALSEVRFGHEQSSALHWMHRHCAWDHCTTRETPRCSESSSTTLIFSCSNGQLSCSAQCVWQPHTHTHTSCHARVCVCVCVRVAACTNRAMRGFVRRVPGRAPRSATLGSTQTATTRSRSSARHRFRSAGPPQTSCAGHLSTAITRPTIRSGHCERVYARADSSVSP